MFYPAYINLQHQKCLVVGGGAIAERKIVSLLLSGAQVTLVSPEGTELLEFLADIDKIVWQKRTLKTGDTYGSFLVCAATDSTAINTAVFREAHDKHKIRLVNVVDVIPQCTFAAASVVTDGELIVSISTSGQSPATSRRIREYLEKILGTNSLYTLGYENGKPTPILNQGLPYPVYLLLHNRRCVLLYRKETPKIARRVSLLQQCGANVVRNPTYLNDAFLVIAESDYMDSHSVGDTEGNAATPLIEYVEQQNAGTYFKPNLIIDENLIISIAARDSDNRNKARELHTKLANAFENRGYGAFIDFLGTLRPTILDALPTSKKRADFFDALIEHVEMDKRDTSVSLHSSRCCLRFTQPECDTECLFNWIQQGRLDAAHHLVSSLLSEASTKQ